MPASLPAPIPGGRVGQLVDRYRCLSCHQIGDKGGDISTAPLTFEGSKVRRDWLVDYLVLSFSIRPILTERMPIFRMPTRGGDELADAIETLYVDPSSARGSVRRPSGLGRRSRRGRAPLRGPRLPRAATSSGRAGGYYGPPLTDSAARLKPGWTYTWLKGPQTWRADVRCPDYGLTDPDALRLTAYLQTMLQKPASTKAGRGGAR